MNKPKIFRVDYPTGYIKVYVGNFFGSSTLKNTDKLLRLAKAHCTEKQRITLLVDLEEAKQEPCFMAKRERIDKCIKRIKEQTWGKHAKSLD